MRSLSNLFKSAYIVQNDKEDRIIDSNEMVAQRLQMLEELERAKHEGPEFEELGEAFVEGLDASQVDELMADRDVAPEVPSPAEEVEAARAEIERLQAQADEIVANAKAQADAVLSQAQEEAQSIEAKAREDGHREGFEAGHAEGLEKVKEAEEALQAREAEINAAYEAKLAEMEPKLINELCAIFQEIFDIDLTGRSDTVMYLLQKAMETIEGGTNYLVQVSPDDYPYASEHKEELMSRVSQAGSLELVEDKTLRQGQSFIETESGIFDCSFGVEMELLCKELKLLSRGGD